MPKKTAAKKFAAVKNTAPRQHQSSKAKYVLTIMILTAAILFIVSKNNKLPEIKKTVSQKIAQTRKSDKDDVIVKKDDKTTNPNDKTSNDKAVLKTEQAADVSVFFLVFQSDETIKYVPVKSSVMTDNKYAAAMKLLISGPSAQMKSKGYQSAFPPGVKVNGVNVVNRVAVIDLSSEIRENAIGDILTARVNQILLTMKNFKEIDGIEIRIDGKAANTLGGDGHVLNWPLKEKL